MTTQDIQTYSPHLPNYVFDLQPSTVRELVAAGTRDRELVPEGCMSYVTPDDVAHMFGVVLVCELSVYALMDLGVSSADVVIRRRGVGGSRSDCWVLPPTTGGRCVGGGYMVNDAGLAVYEAALRGLVTDEASLPGSTGAATLSEADALCADEDAACEGAETLDELAQIQWGDFARPVTARGAL